MSRYRFDQFTLDTDLRTLQAGDRNVEVQPLIFDLLAYFARNPGRVIGREELLHAVWRSPVVTPSVVARAVMKARRTIDDDANAPRSIVTVARAGYRFDAEVSLAEPRPAYRLAVLPFRDEPADTELTWRRQGLRGLADHLAAVDGSIMLAPAADVSTLRLGGIESKADQLERACRMLGAEEALACEILRTEGGLALHVRRGASQDRVQTHTYTGDDPVELTLRMVAELIGQLSGQTVPVSSVEPNWHRQFAQALDLEHRGQYRQALDLLGGCLPHLEASANLRLLHARLLRRSGQLDAAKQAIAVAMTELDGQPASPASARVRIELMLVLAQCQLDAMALADGRRLCEEAIMLAEEHPDGRTLVPQALALCSVACLLADQGDAALSNAQRALSRAIATGNQVLAAQVRLRLANVLAILDRSEQAAEVASLVASHAQRCGLMRLEIEALYLLATLAISRREFSQADQFARQGANLCASSGDQMGLQSARIVSTIAMVGANRLDEAERRLRSLGDLSQLLVQLVPTGQLLQIILERKQGRCVGAIQRLEGILAVAGQERAHWSSSVAVELLMHYVEDGRLTEAEALLEQRVQHDRRRSCVAMARAAIAFARGQRQAAIDTLRAHLALHTGQSSNDMDARLDLAWLLLEDEPPHAPDAELDALAAMLLDYAPELLAAQVFRAAYLLRRSPSAPTVTAWDTVVSQARPLQRNCPWISRREYRDALVAGSPMRLPQLLDRACF